MTDHTPAPWYVHETPTVIGVRSNVLSVYSITKSRKYFPMQLANARLIASVPEMLNALEFANAMFSGVDIKPEAVKQRIQSALIKAKGEQA